MTKTLGSGSSRVVEQCQICDDKNLNPFLFLGYMPPVNKMPDAGSQPKEQPSYPAQMLYCDKCHLVQLGLIVDPKILFPPEYPYTSSTTKILRENFADLYKESSSLLKLESDDLIVDIGSNDGNLLSNFKDHHRVQGVTPEDIGKIAVERGIPTIFNYFGEEAVDEILKTQGNARVITATNVFAHMEDIHSIVKSILKCLDQEKGVFISESHYLGSLVETLQYDTIYHEHMRYYSLHSLKFLLEMHGLEVFHVTKIPTHGGSIRVYAGHKNKNEIQKSVKDLLDEERKNILSLEALENFKHDVVLSKIHLYALLKELKDNDAKIFGIGAPSRGSTLINYIGLDDGIIDSVLEIEGSHKIGKFMPGTVIPVENESRLFNDQPDYAMLFSWHIADELMPKLKEKGFKGDFIVPLPEPRVIRNEDI